MATPGPKLEDDCFAHDSRRLRHDEALAILKERVRPVAGLERIALPEAAGRVLAQAAIAPHPVPAQDNAAVDGFSFAAADYDGAAGACLKLGGRAAAGHALEGRAAPGTAARIFTGALIPDGHDTVVMQEDVRTGESEGQLAVSIPPGLRRGANVRRAGEDVKEGETVLVPGAVLRPQDLSALASLGFAELTCFRRLRVAIVSSGDEVVRAGAPLQRGQVHDANAPMLAPLIANAGATPVDLGVLPDRLDAVKEKLREAARRFDVILTTGGASRGEEDHMVAALDALGRRHLWQLAIKPGRPMSFGQIEGAVLLGLPGNPVAVFVCFLLYAWPLLRRLGGAEWPEPRRYSLPALFTVPKRKLGRREFWRGILRRTPRGLAVDKFARDGSGLICGLRAADGLIDIPEDVAGVKPGDAVAFIPFAEFGIAGQ